MPIIPHFSNECLSLLGTRDNIKWPNYDKVIIEEDFVNIVVQINGKKRGLIKTKKNLQEDIILENIRNTLFQSLDYFKTLTAEEILNHRKDKFLKIGRSKGFVSSPESLSAIQTSGLDFKEIIKSRKNIAIALAILAIVAALTLFIL